MSGPKSAPGKFGLPYLLLQQRPLPKISTGQIFLNQVRGSCLYGGIKMIEESISVSTSRLRPDNDDLDNARAFMSIAAAYMARHKLTSSLEDLQAATVLLVEAAHALPNGHADKAMVHDLVATAHVELCACDMSSLAVHMGTAVQQYSMAVRLEPDKDYQAAGSQFVAILRHSLYKRTGDAAYLDDSDARLSLEQTPKFNSQWYSRFEMLSIIQSDRYSKFEDINDLKSSIKYAQDILDYGAEEYALSHEQLVKLGSAYCTAGIKHQDTDILDTAIRVFDNILDTMPEDHKFRAEAVCHHGKVYEAKYDVTRDVAFLEVAARQAIEALQLTPRSDKSWKSHLFRAVNLWYALYQLNKAIDYLETADGFLGEAIAVLDEGSEMHYMILNKRAILAYNRIFDVRNPSSIATAIHRMEEVLQKVPIDKRSGNDYDACLKELLATQRAIQASLPSLQPGNSGSPSKEYEETQEDASSKSAGIDWALVGLPRVVLEDKIPAESWSQQLIEEAAHDVPQQDEQAKSDLTNVSDALLVHRNVFTDASKLKELVDRSLSRLPAELISDTTDPGGRDHGSLMSGLEGVAAWNQYTEKLREFRKERLQSMEEGVAKRPTSRIELDECLDSAIQALEKLLEPEFPEMLRLPVFLEDLATAYVHRWARTHDETDLDRGVEILKKALGKVSPDDPTTPSLLHQIGCVFMDKYRTRGALTDLETAMSYLTEALGRVLVLAGLMEAQAGSILQPLPGWKTRSLPENLEEVLETHGDELFTYSGSLGEAFFALYHRTRAHADLVRVLQWVERATDWRVFDSIKVKLNLLPALSVGCIEKFKVTKDLADADLSIACLRQAMVGALQTHDGEVFQRHTVQLSQLYRDRYVISGDTDDLGRELKYLQVTLKNADDDYELKALCLERLGKAHKDRHGRIGDKEDLQKAVKYLQEALSYDKDWPVHGIIGGKELFRIYTSQGNWLEAHETASTIFARVHHTVGWALESRDKQALLRQYAGLASDAAAAAVLAGQSAFTALRYLETGRGVIASSLLGLRSELDDLEKDHPELAKEYSRARDQVDYVKRVPRNEAARWLPVNQPTHRHQATKSLNNIVEKIRALPGYASFLKEMPEEKMRAAATTAGGPIIIINVSRYCCHAIIIREEDGITNHVLPNLKKEDIEERAQKNTVQGMTSDVLEWLWDEIVSPVMAILDFARHPLPSDNSPSWHRVWWIPTGPLARLPLHAAGYHKDPIPRERTVLDRVISSYSLSVSALVQSQISLSKATAASSSPSSHEHGKPEVAVLLGMDGDLEHALRETREVAKICRDMMIKWPEAQTDPLLRVLRTADIFHFAGHGSSDIQDPLKSALILRGQDRLTVSNLFEMNLHERRPFLAFLSACSTGKVRQDDALDEGLHLISACQVAGFRHVIGTLWEVNDATCVHMAQMVYKSMHQQGLVHASVSESLHFASRWLRDEWARDEEDKRIWLMEKARAQGRDVIAVESADEDGPLFWLPYVHYGI